MNYQNIQAQKTPEKIGIITLNRPERKNALSIKLRQEISECLNDWVDAIDVGAVIFIGAGESFSAGFDLKEFSHPELMEEIFTSSAKYHRDVWNFPKPTIAAVKGHALGGGFDLTTLCDIRISSGSAVFGHPEIKFGAPPLFTPLRWIVGHGLARDLCLTGRRIDSREAYRIGLVSEVVQEEGLLDRALQIARTIVEAPLETLSVTKRYMIQDAALGFEESFINEHDIPFQAVIPKK
jgi:enoyl-CoA hydratase/carnithine racemase